MNSVGVGTYTGPNATLVAAAFSVSINVYPRHDGARATSFASREDLEAVISAVLGRAGSPVAFDQILNAVGERVGSPPVRGVDALGDHDVVDPHEPALGERAEVADVVAALSAEERAALPHRDLSDRDLGARRAPTTDITSAMRRPRTPVRPLGNGPSAPVR